MTTLNRIDLTAFRRDYKLLKPRYQQMLIMRYGLMGEVPMTYKQLSQHWQVTQQRCQQIVALALSKLRQSKQLQIKPEELIALVEILQQEIGHSLVVPKVTIMLKLVFPFQD
jgi:hypothetical protein